jgi:hypothetical protein
MDKKLSLIQTILEQAKQQNPDHYTYAVPTIFSKKLGSLMLIREDILACQEAISRLISIKEERQEKGLPSDTVGESSLWYSAIIQYGHCFNSNKGGHTRLEASEIIGDNADLMEIHDNIMDLRNGYVAHRDDTEHEQAVVMMQLPIEGDIPEKTKFYIKAAKTFSPSVESLKGYLQLFEFLLPKIEEKIQKQTEKTQDAFLKNLDATQINMLRL